MKLQYKLVVEGSLVESSGENYIELGEDFVPLVAIESCLFFPAFIFANAIEGSEGSIEGKLFGERTEANIIQITGSYEIGQIVEAGVVVETSEGGATVDKNHPYSGKNTKLVYNTGEFSG